MNELEKAYEEIERWHFYSNQEGFVYEEEISYLDYVKKYINNLQSKIDKVNRILNANTHVENIYHALCNLFDEKYQYEIDNEELNDILKEDK